VLLSFQVPADVNVLKFCVYVSPIAVIEVCAKSEAVLIPIKEKASKQNFKFV
jgi:hypothetical protein